MMKTRVALLLLGFIAAPMAPETARAGSVPLGIAGSLHVRGVFGYATQSLGDVNDNIKQARAEINADPAFTGSDWDPYAGAATFGVDVGYGLSPMFTLGLGLDYQSSKLEHSATLDFYDPSLGNVYGVLGEDQKVSALSVYATSVLWLPAAAGLHFGAELGMVRGKFQLQDGVIVNSDSGFSVVLAGDGDADGTGLVLGIFAGYEYPVSSLISFSGRVGYRYANAGELEGHYQLVDPSSGPVVTSDGPVTDFNGRPMDFDFSGLRANVGLTLRLGGGP